ncbi:MAG: phosphotransferase [candidate division Zixibacteria bacterium]|nr:phosphotransferase [candidate division Zixibacteria bacterium]
MKSLDELTPRSKIQRLRRLAGKALNAFGFKDVRFELITIAGNVLFRVYELTPCRTEDENSPFKPGQYLLRIHDRREQDTNAIQLEMEWLSAIRQDTGLAVPEPIRSLDGNLRVRVSTPEIQEKRDCTLLRWLNGRRLTKNIKPRHFQAQGRVMAQLHNHAARWSPPKGLSKRRFDYDGLFYDNAGAELSNREAWPYLTDRHRKAYEEIARKVKLVMDDRGKKPDVYGLIHGDCGIDANVLFRKGEAQIIDFDGSGFGYYLYDLALALEHCWEEPEYPAYLDALLKGYTEFRSLPDDYLRHMDLFRAAFYVHMGLWTVAVDQTHPDSPNKPSRHKKWLEYGLRFIEHHLENG